MLDLPLVKPTGTEKLTPNPIGTPVRTTCPHCGGTLGAEAHVLIVGDLELNLWTRRFRRLPAGQPIVLSAREYQFAEAFMRNPRRVLTKFQISEIVYGASVMAEDSNVVDVQVCMLRKKLGVGVTMIRTFRGVGYSLEDSE